MKDKCCRHISSLALPIFYQFLFIGIVTWYCKGINLFHLFDFRFRLGMPMVYLLSCFRDEGDEL